MFIVLGIMLLFLHAHSASLYTWHTYKTVRNIQHLTIHGIHLNIQDSQKQHLARFCMNPVQKVFSCMIIIHMNYIFLKFTLIHNINIFLIFTTRQPNNHYYCKTLFCCLYFFLNILMRFTSLMH